MAQYAEATQRRELNRDLLRAAGEHLGALAQRQREACDVEPYRRAGWQKEWDRYAKLERLSREVLEVANA
jgi:hypothetical protein